MMKFGSNLSLIREKCLGGGKKLRKGRDRKSLRGMKVEKTVWKGRERKLGCVACYDQI